MTPDQFYLAAQVEIARYEIDQMFEAMKSKLGGEHA